MGEQEWLSGEMRRAMVQKRMANIFHSVSCADVIKTVRSREQKGRRPKHRKRESRHPKRLRAEAQSISIVKGIILFPK